jgi:hypothetical protein
MLVLSETSCLSVLVAKIAGFEKYDLLNVRYFSQSSISGRGAAKKYLEYSVAYFKIHQGRQSSLGETSRLSALVAGMVVFEMINGASAPLGARF